MKDSFEAVGKAGFTIESATVCGGGAKSPLWRKIILLRYFRNRTQQETADELGLSQVKVSREEKKILQSLRAELS